MAISFSNYVKITSGVGAATLVTGRNFEGRFFTVNPLLPTGSFEEYNDAESVGTYFGFQSEEFQRATFYFNWVSKNITSPNQISFSRWTSADTAPLIFGAVGSQSVATYQAINNGSFSLTIGGITNSFTGLNFSSVISLADVAAVIQTAINAESGTIWSGATVVFNASRGSFDFTGGATGLATISVTEGTSGTPIAAILGWLTGAILSNGDTAETITETLQNSWDSSNNFGSFAFLPSLTLDQIVDAATWTDGMNVQVMYSIPVSLANASSYEAAITNYGGCGLTISENTNPSGISSVAVISGGLYSVTPTPQFIGNGSGASLSTQLKISTIAVTAQGFGYVANDTIVLSGGVFSTQASIKVLSTLLVSYTMTSGGTGFAPGDTITFTGGTFSIAAQLVVDTVSGGAILTSHISNHGSYSANTPGTSYTTSGSGTGATFTTLHFGVNTLQVLNSGVYTTLPTNPVGQASTSGAGTGATFTIAWTIIAVNVVTAGTGFDLESQLIFLNGAENAQVSLTLQPPPDQYAEQVPMMIFAATDYTAVNSVQNYMFQTFNLVPTVTDDATSDSLDAINVNYYGATQESGQQIAFYQRGLLSGLPTSPSDMNVFANEIWLKDAAGVAIINLLLSVSQVPANKSGTGLILSVLQNVIDQAVNNGTISVGKTLTNNQKLYITQITGDPNAWQQVQNIGYWINCVISPYTDEGGNTEYQAVYTLIYSKDDVIRKVTGTHVLI
jgi:hypothetical protein